MRLIDANELYETISRWLDDGNYNFETRNALRCALYEIKSAPTAEKKGEWIPVVDGNYIVWECSECHVESEAWTDYCPICGSRNIEEMDDDVTYEEALEEFRKNLKTYTLDEVEAELGLTTEKKGKWIPNNVVNAVCPWCCSECNSNQADRTPYCQMCGAKMEESDGERYD